MVQSVLQFLKGCRHAQYRFILLQRDDAAGGKTATVKITLDPECDFIILVAGPHEIGVQRMGHAFGRHRILRRGQRLRNYLPAKNTAHAAGFTLSQIPAVTHAVNGQQFFQFGYQRLCAILYIAHNPGVSRLYREMPLAVCPHQTAM